MENLKKPSKVTLNSKAYLVLTILYILVCTLVNTEPLMEHVDNKWFFAFVIALIFALIETKVAKLAGKSLVLKLYTVAIVSLVIGFGMVAYFTMQQKDPWFGVIIALLFMVGVLFSYSFEYDKEKMRIPNKIKYLTLMVSYYLSLQKFHELEITNLNSSITAKANKDVYDRIESLKEQLTAINVHLSQIPIKKEEALQSLEFLEQEIVSAIREGHAGFQAAA